MIIVSFGPSLPGVWVTDEGKVSEKLKDFNSQNPVKNMQLESQSFSEWNSRNVG